MEYASLVGTAIQLSGTVLVSILCAILLQTVRKPFLHYWAFGWLSLSVALAALVGALVYPSAETVLLPAYCFGEYVAGYFWIAGCRNLGGNFRLTAPDVIWTVPAAIVATVAPQAADGIGQLMAFHTLIMAAIFAAGFAVLYHYRERAQGAGSGVMMAAFFLLTANFIQYAPFYVYSFFVSRPNAFPHLQHLPLYALLLQMLLAFGMVMVVMEYVRRELEAANHELRKTGSRLKWLAERDQLTGALNRHAYDELSRMSDDPRRPFTGVVALIDVDNLKPINDTLGHPAGDRAIQMVAQAIRSVIRPDDLLFRWGGDEFLIMWVGQLKEADAEMRLERLNEELARNARAAGVNYPEEPSVSFGLAAFPDRLGVDEAIQLADERMYARKQAKKGQVSRREASPPLAGARVAAKRE
jgi:diguanylate cyclase (GGDEF)-like protein